MPRVTIKDISAKTGLSSGSIHRALYGKKGVSEEVRAKVINVANELGYTPNYSASALKRKSLHIVVAFPTPTGDNRFFYSYIWQGIRQCIADNLDFNINITEVTYDNSPESKNKALLDCLAQNKNNIDGLITQGYMGEQGELAVKAYSKLGVPIVLVGDDVSNINRLCCVQANHVTTGMMACELISTQIPRDGSILIATGNPLTPSHYETVEGVKRYIERNNLSIKLIEIPNQGTAESTYDKIVSTLKENNSINAVYSVNAKRTITICSAVQDLGLVNIKAIGSDIFSESIEFMKQGILNNIFFKNPSNQAYTGLKILINYLVKNEVPKTNTMYINTEVVFKSNLYTFE